jgi:hypothetical protein
MIRKRFVFENSPYSLARFCNTAGTTLVTVIFLCAAGIVVPVTGTMQSANASSTRIPSCSTADVREVISTSQQTYGPGVMVVMKSSVRNMSSRICNVAVGPTSPSITVTNSNGIVVWNNCYANDKYGACALYLVAHTLNPEASYVKTVAWDQRSGQPPARVPMDTYHLTTQFSAIAGTHATEFQLTTTASSRSITVTQADSGRSISLHEIARLYVQLTVPAIYTWTDPISSGGAVLVRSVGSSGNIATAAFVAKSTGHVRVTAINNPKCYPQCLIPSRLFVLTVSVIS